jgi:hypothetical protein
MKLHKINVYCVKNLIRVCYMKSTDLLISQCNEVNVSTNSNFRIISSVLTFVGNIGIMQYNMISLNYLFSKWNKNNLQDALSFAQREDDVEGHDCRSDNGCPQLEDTGMEYTLTVEIINQNSHFLWAGNKLVCLKVYQP